MALTCSGTIRVMKCPAPTVWPVTSCGVSSWKRERSDSGVPELIEKRRHPAGCSRLLLTVPDQQVLLPSRQRHLPRERRQPGDEPRLDVGVVRREEELLRVPPLHLLVVRAPQPGSVLAGLGASQSGRTMAESSATTAAGKSGCRRANSKATLPPMRIRPGGASTGAGIGETGAPWTCPRKEDTRSMRPLRRLYV